MPIKLNEIVEIKLDQPLLLGRFSGVVLKSKSKVD